MVKLPMDLQRTKESSGGCQRSSNSQVDVFKLFPLAVAGERHDGAARVGTFGGAMPVVDGVLSVGQMGGVWRHQRRHAGAAVHLPSDSSLLRMAHSSDGSLLRMAHSLPM